jgi:hypothetical protein
MVKKVIPWCRIQKRDKNPPLFFGQLLPPFKHVATFYGIPTVDYNWKNFLKKRFGEGEYLVTLYGVGIRGTVKLWHGRV